MGTFTAIPKLGMDSQSAKGTLAWGTKRKEYGRWLRGKLSSRPAPPDQLPLTLALCTPPLRLPALPEITGEIGLAQ